MLIKANSEKTSYMVSMQSMDGTVLSQKSIRELDLIVDYKTEGTVETDLFLDDKYIPDDAGCIEEMIHDTAGNWCVQAQRDLALEYLADCSKTETVPVPVKFIYERTFRSAVG